MWFLGEAERVELSGDNVAVPAVHSYRTDQKNTRGQKTTKKKILKRKAFYKTQGLWVAAGCSVIEILFNLNKIKNQWNYKKLKWFWSIYWRWVMSKWQKISQFLVNFSIGQSCISRNSRKNPKIQRSAMRTFFSSAFSGGFAESFVALTFADDPPKML